MKAIYLFGFLIVFQSFAFAGISGHWVGQGEWTYEGSGTDCSMSLSFSESAIDFKRLGGYFNCNIVDMHSDPLTWSKKGEDLLAADGLVIGKITDTLVQFKEDYSETVSIQTTVQISGDSMSYAETWYDKGKVLYEITGDFKKIN